MNYILFDGPARKKLLPFTFTRPVADIRIGILTIREKWEKHLGSTTTTITEDYLSSKWPMVEMEENIMINGSYLPTASLVSQIKDLKPQQAIFDGEEVVAFFSLEDEEVDFESCEQIEITSDPFRIENTYDIFSRNGEAIIEDFKLLTGDRVGLPIPASNNVINPDDIFIEEGAKVEFATLNASTGPIYIAANSEIMEGALIRGPFSLGEYSVVKMGSKIYGPTTVGPYSKVGGEVTNSVIFAYSNKG